MAKINPALLARLASKIGVTETRVYALIQETSAENHVERHIGALILAGQHGISQQKYANGNDMADLRQARGASTQPAHIVANPPTSITLPRTRTPARKASKKIVKTKENTVFVVHGRDQQLTDDVYQLLGALGLKPLEWGHAIKSVRGAANPFVSDAVQKILEEAQAIVVLLTPDDEAQLKTQFVGKAEKLTEGRLRGQARANVIFEAGLAIGAHHQKTLVVQLGDVKPFTDIGGMHILRLNDSAPSRHQFANRLKKLGCKLDQDGDHWLRTGKLTPTKQKKKPKKKTT